MISAKYFIVWSTLMMALSTSLDPVNANVSEPHDRLTIAVASNFSSTMKILVNHYHKETGHRINVAYGSSGKLFSQIVHGAPFAAFLSADQSYVNRLSKLNIVRQDSRFTYAVGQLALWSNRNQLPSAKIEALRSEQFSYLAIANPKFAPYGRAATEVIERLKLEEAIVGKLVIGENIMQAFQFVQTGNADFGLIAHSQVIHFQSTKNAKSEGTSWLVPADLYEPILQDAVILQSAKDNRVIEDFFGYLQSETAKEIILASGYRMLEE